MIFFDIDETLFDNNRAQNLAARSFYYQFPALQDRYTKSAFALAWNAVTEKYLQQFFANQISFQQQRRKRLRDIFQKELPKEQADKIAAIYLNFYEENWGLFDDVIPCLDTLRSHKLGIISNGEKVQQRQKLKDLNIFARFEVIIISDDIGISKPDPEIFWHGCKTANESPAECYYVGDNFKTDAKAASRAGMQAIWLNRGREKGKDRAIREIRTLSQLPKLIQS